MLGDSMFGVTEILIIVLVLLVLFGGSRLPGIGRGLGEGIRSFRDAFKRTEDDVPRGEDDPR
jgi:sec-independent protein translocase protein TatA